MDLTRAMLILGGYFENGTDSHDYGCVMADAPEPLRDKIETWSRYRIEDSSLYYNQDDPSDSGREYQSHVTVLYGLHTANPLDIAAIIEAQRIAPFGVTLGRVALFSKPACDVVKIDVSGDGLLALNAALSALPNSNQYPTYQPHLTIAYVKPGIGLVFEDAANFEGLTFKVDRVRFSAATGRTTVLPLYGVQVG